jgi:hypothetical protein
MLWDLPPYCPAQFCHRLGGTSVFFRYLLDLLFVPANEDSTLLRNVRGSLPDYTVLQRRKGDSSSRYPKNLRSRTCRVWVNGICLDLYEAMDQLLISAGYQIRDLFFVLLVMKS